MKKALFILSCVFVFSGLFSGNFLYAQNEDLEKSLEEKIARYQKILSELEGTEQTLKREIDYLTTQINITELKIQQAISEIERKNSQIKKLEGDIEDLKSRLVKLDETIAFQMEILGKRSRARYISFERSPLYLIIGFGDVKNFVQKMEYLKTMLIQDKKLLDQMEETKNVYDKQKDLLGDKKEQIEELKRRIEDTKANLEIYSQQLDAKKIEKQKLLELTQNSEEKYQELLRQAKAELEAIQGIVATVNFANGTKIKKGDVIGYMGNSGAPYCSTGSHLHFEIRKNGVVVNPENYLKSLSVFTYHYSTGVTKIGSGDWDWPMRNPQVTQRFGRTPWSWRYPGNSHTGIDMVSDDTRIYAPADGIYIRSTQRCYGVNMNYAAIDHGDGVVSYYLHIR